MLCLMLNGHWAQLLIDRDVTSQMPQAISSPLTPQVPSVLQQGETQCQYTIGVASDRLPFAQSHIKGLPLPILIKPQFAKNQHLEHKELINISKTSPRLYSISYIKTICMQVLHIPNISIYHILQRIFL